MPASDRLRVEPSDGSPVRDYRILAGVVETRILDAAGKTDPRTGSSWYPLSADEIAGHVRRNSVVAQWLLVRLGQSALVQAWLQSGLRSDAERTVECDQAA
jgi:hypothetical protein